MAALWRAADLRERELGVRVAFVLGPELDEFVGLLPCELVGIAAHGPVRPRRYRAAPRAFAGARDSPEEVAVMNDYGNGLLSLCERRHGW